VLQFRLLAGANHKIARKAGLTGELASYLRRRLN
jgi:hypothetical protein